MTHESNAAMPPKRREPRAGGSQRDTGKTAGRKGKAGRREAQVVGDGNSYASSQLKRHRATGDEMEQRRRDVKAIVAGIASCTVRQCFYQASVRGIVEKTEAGYGKVQRMLAEMRRAGDIGYGDIVDNTRWMRKPRTFDSLQAALDHTARFYRRSLWPDADCYVEVWLEKDALSGVIMPITAKYDVPLMVARGYASLSFLASAAECIAEQQRPTYIYHLGDFDPSGVNAGEKIEQTLRELASDAEIHFKRLAVNPEQIKKWRLPSRPTKTTDSRAKKFGRAESVELDAIHPDRLREIVEKAILSHVGEHELQVLEAAEESERAILKAFAINHAAEKE